MAEPNKPDFSILFFFLFALLAILPAVVLFTILRPLGALAISTVWIALVGLIVAQVVKSERKTIPTGAPAASIVASTLGFKMQNDRVLAGELDGIPLKAIWSPSGTRIDATFASDEAPPLDDWLALLTSEQRLAMSEAVESGDLEVSDGTLQIRTSLSFRVPEHGEDLVFRLRDAAQVARQLRVAGAPPDGCVEALRAERRRAAAGAAGTLSLAAPDAAQGAVTLAQQAGALSLPKKS